MEIPNARGLKPYDHRHRLEHRVYCSRYSRRSGGRGAVPVAPQQRPYGNQQFTGHNGRPDENHPRSRAGDAGSSRPGYHPLISGRRELSDDQYELASMMFAIAFASVLLVVGQLYCLSVIGR
jgi:hypothetical protein